jgi:hypothetical protein
MRLTGRLISVEAVRAVGVENIATAGPAGAATGERTVLAFDVSVELDAVFERYGLTQEIQQSSDWESTRQRSYTAFRSPNFVARESVNLSDFRRQSRWSPRQCLTGERIETSNSSMSLSDAPDRERFPHDAVG